MSKDQKQETTEKVTANESALINEAFTLRRDLIQKLLDDTRDLDTECGYPNVIDTADYQRMFDRNGIGNRIVRLWPEECWNSLPEVCENDDSKDTDFEKEWKELERKYHLFSYLYRLDVLSGIGRFGVLLIGVNDGKLLAEPIESSNGLELIYLKVFSESVIEVKSKETDTKSPRYGLPVVYTIKTEAVDGELSAEQTDLHWHRVIHVADNRAVSETFGTPRLKTTYNYVLDLKKTLGGSAEMFWKGGFPGIMFEVNKERTEALTTKEKKSMREEFENYSNKLQRYMALVGVTAKSMTPQVADPSNHFAAQLKAIAITLGVPYRMFMGSEQAKLASTQDTKTWNRRIAKRQNDYLTPLVIRPIVDRFIELCILKEPKEYEVKWPSLEELDPKDASEIAKNKTESMVKYVMGGVEAIMPPSQFLVMILGFTDEEAEAILKEATKFLDDRVDENDLEEEE